MTQYRQYHCLYNAARNEGEIPGVYLHVHRDNVLAALVYPHRPQLFRCKSCHLRRRPVFALHESETY